MAMPLEAVRSSRTVTLVTALALSTGGGTAGSQQLGRDPLPSWNDGVTKQAIVGFVQRARTEFRPNRQLDPSRARGPQDGSGPGHQPACSIEHLNAKHGKPLAIDRQTGQRPILVAANVLSGGDVAMMDYSAARPGPTLQLLINHDDAERELAYVERRRRIAEGGASMKNDWKRIYRDQ